MALAAGNLLDEAMTSGADMVLRGGRTHIIVTIIIIITIIVIIIIKIIIKLLLLLLSYYSILRGG